ncbi:MAG: hypothetical protein ABI867_10905 [Kofleriaceae bacterium]
MGPSSFAPCALLSLLACGDNRPGPDAEAEPGLAFFEMPTLPEYNHISETSVAAAGNTVVALAIHQRFFSADSFEFPEEDNDPERPFRRLGYVRSTDGGVTFSETTPLVLAGRSDPVVVTAADGTFWAAGIDPQKNGQTDLFHSSDGATFTKITSVPIQDKAWITVDEARQSVWVAGFPTYSEVGFDGTVRATVTGPGGIASAYTDTAGLHVMDINKYQAYSWTGVATDAPQPEGAELPGGDAPSPFTFPSLQMGASVAGTWIVRGLRNSDVDAPIVVRVRQLPDEGSDVAITAAGAVASLPTAALDAEGRLHVAWYDTRGPFGQLLYAHSETTDLTGRYTPPMVVDGNACPGNGFYPDSARSDPPGGRRLREYIGITTSGRRAFITWTHAPEAPSRVRIAHVDF